MKYELDENLRPFATDSQWEKLKALAEHGSDRRAAEALGLSSKSSILNARRAVIARAAGQGYSPDHDMTHPVPDGFRLKGTTSLYNMETGEGKLQWVKTEADKERQAEIFREAVKALASDIPRVRPTKGPDKASDNLMACYPVGDHHLGMLAWDEEAGDNYDLSIGERLLFQATEHLVKVTPSCAQASIVFLGDFMHYDSFEAVTPKGRNQLDVDSRYPKMVRAAIRSMRNLIETALRRHWSVHVIVEIGNHDLSSSIFLMECLFNIYENEPRVTVDTTPMHFHYLEFGKCAVGTHHGHGTKMANLPLIMAADRPEMWGRTEYRYWWTGHVHHDQTKDYNGTKVESFRVLAPADAWASQKGYRSARDMKAIVLHREFGEVARHTVNPDMF